ncbi:subtilisin-like protease SBT5.4 [Citrus sinensis]|uniref:Subtilisin-like protease SBT5.4 n=1 Tax=Citrus sinensis TaxID=2711 RepID=A0ACB8NJI1_CITSI|nr:subtilisin-like protease SBT5.4 [Citrus sinensis]
MGNGTAKGGSPKARVAAYKVCWPQVSDGQCFDADILKGFDMAIHDGVDVISVSLGGDPADYFNDGTAIGAFHAVKHGIVVVCSAANSGPELGTVTNVSPWIITVGASTLDRDLSLHSQIFRSLVSLPTFYMLSLCKNGALDHEKVKGKILVCLRGDTARVDKGRQAAVAGAVGMILCNDKSSGNEITADPHFLPASQITYKDGVKVLDYIKSSDNPMGYITSPSTYLNAKPSPFMASFSSAGPNKITPEILKPDITAPGVNIIAAFTGAIGATELPYDTRRIPYNIMSGTSMSCPHVAGVVGLLKTAHPDWSPSAIRSAIMTTATPFSYGSGHIRPNRAMDPGLVYDLSEDDYLDFLCSIGYNQTTIKRFFGTQYECSKSANLEDFNYPSISVPMISGSVTLSRKLKNVGSPSNYAASVREPLGISVSVEPKILAFKKIGEEKSFKVTLKPKWSGAPDNYRFGELTWTDGKHYVRSPIVVNQAQAEAESGA